MNRIFSGADAAANGFYELQPGFRLNLKDKRLDALVQRVEDFIANNKLKVPQHEELICKEIVKFIHSDEFYGPYNKKLQNIQDQLHEIEVKEKQVKFKVTDPEEKNKQLAELDSRKKDLKEQGLQISLTKFHSNLADYPKGSLVCLEQSLIAGYVMAKVNLPNDICADQNSRDSSIIQHVFVQSHSSLNIIEATDPIKPYRQNLNHGIIIKGEIAATRSADGIGVKLYGEGGVTEKEEKKAKHSKDEHAELKKLHEVDVKKAWESYEKHVLKNGRKMEEHDRGHNISVEDAVKHAEYFAVQVDRPKTLLGLIPVGKRDAKLSGKERLDFFDDMGMTIPEKMKGLLLKDDLPVQNFAAQSAFKAVKMDTNKDKQISPEEFSAYVADAIKTENKVKPMDPKSMQKMRDSLGDMIYGR